MVHFWGISWLKSIILQWKNKQKNAIETISYENSSNNNNNSIVCCAVVMESRDIHQQKNYEREKTHNWFPLTRFNIRIIFICHFSLWFWKFVSFSNFSLFHLNNVFYLICAQNAFIIFAIEEIFSSYFCSVASSSSSLRFFFLFFFSESYSLGVLSLK